MFALIAAALLAAADVPSTPADEDARRAYQAARESAGRSPDDQVRLAFWCEAHGLDAERARHLALAVLADPTHAAARGLLGLVARGERWLRPEAVADQVKADAPLAASLAEYDAKRAVTPYTADGQWALAQWAEGKGLKDQARAHLTAVVRLDPRRDEAWKRLGYHKLEGRWVTDAELAAAKADAEAQKEADRKWRPLLEKWKAQAARPSQREEAEAGLRTVTDPRAVPMIGKVFGAHEADATRAALLLGQVDSPASSRALAHLAAFAASAEARRVAAETLRGRDPREFAHLLIGLIARPIHYEVRRVGGPDAPGVLYVEGKTSNLKRLYEPGSPIGPTDRLTVDRFGQPVIEHVTNAWAYSRWGKPFNPNQLLGYGESYSDLYGRDGYTVGNMVDRPWVFQQMNWLNARQEMASWQGNNLGSLPTPTTAAGLAAQLQAKQKGSTGPAQVRLDPLAFSNAYLPGITPRVDLAGLGANFDPRDVASETAVQIPLAQAMNEAGRSAAASQQQLDRDVAELDRRNRATNERNDRAVAVLNDVTGQNLQADRTAWEKWWVDMLGYAFVEGQSQANPTLVEVVPSGYQPQAMPTNVVTRQIYVNGISCFAAGTMVRTITGPRPIEGLRVGDVILTQSTSTGALGYQPITVTHHNPPAATFRVKLGDDAIVASHFHRFWVARRGWVMARDLKAGDPIRTLGGVRAVESVEPGKVELVFNLDVAGDADFFAGESAALVHDNTLPDPRLVPFDLPAEPAAKVVAAAP